ncbi:MAG: acylphosphatase [Corynebacterium sp.]|uniref:acylphosphatase n=1 Tax=Corynebacterium sp. TaxID=1720 RepID=UPI0026DD467F|nr:acylphosphatase [Corynebacterium sp.]MDO5099044.1 acylphosphatase [Corynebacterium sp.]
MADVRLTAWVHGYVQGVGFRWWVYGQAKELKLSGSATNLVDGRVCVVAEGSQEDCEQLLHRLEIPDAVRTYRRPGSVERVIHQWNPARGLTDFVIR